MAKKKKRKAQVPPTCNCLLLCEDVLTSASGKHYLNGIIGHIVVQDFPAPIGGFVAYVRISNLHAKEGISLNFSRAEDEQVLASANLDFTSQTDPLGVYTIISRIPVFSVPAAGRYMFNAVLEGVPFAQFPLEISAMK